MHEALPRQDHLVTLFGVATVISGAPLPSPFTAGIPMRPAPFAGALPAGSEVTRGLPRPRHLESRPRGTRLHF